MLPSLMLQHNFSIQLMAFWSESDFRDGPKDCLYSKAIRRNENDDSSDVFAVHVISSPLFLVSLLGEIVVVVTGQSTVKSRKYHKKTFNMLFV